MFARPGSLLFCVLALWMLLQAACRPADKKPQLICPGKASVKEALRELRDNYQSALAFKSTGNCTAKFYNQKEKKYHKEDFPVKIWIKPPSFLRLHGNVAFKPRGIDLGCNRCEFWLILKPKEVKGYYWGVWEQQNNTGQLLMDPAVMLETLGVIDLQDSNQWSLSQKGPFDILEHTGSEGCVNKKMYVNCCTYRIEKIEYLKNTGFVNVVAELAGYEKISGGFYVPSSITITSYQFEKPDSIRIEINSIEPYSFDERKMKIFFSRPTPKGFEQVYKIIKGKLVREK